jgi:polysaccharide pyruvyl transferase WcaK-like protein
MTNVLITCAYGNYFDMEVDKGNLALIISTSDALRAVISEVEIVTLWQLSEDFCRQHKIRSVPNKRMQFRAFSLITSIKSSADLFLAASWYILHHHINLNIKSLINSQRLKARAAADIIIDLSMDLWTEEMGILTIIEHSKDLLTSIFLDKPVVIYAQSMGPFRLKLTRWLARYTFNKVSLIMLRESISRGYIEDVGVNRPPVYITAEPAFRLKPAPARRINEIMVKEGIKPDAIPFVGITWMSVGWRRPSNIRARFVKKIIYPLYSFMRWLLPEQPFENIFRLIGGSFLSRGLRSEQYRMNLLCELVNYINENLHATVIIIPHTSQYMSLGKALSLKEELQPFLKYKDRAKIICNNYSPEEIKGIIGHCDLFIGSKMHASIAALSQCVPTVLIPYSHKFHAATDPLCQEKLICDSVEIGDLEAKINEVWVNRYMIRKEIESRIDAVMEQALLNAKLVSDIVNSSQDSTNKVGK